MTVSYTSLVYGSDVRTCDLVAAGRAFAELEPAFDTITRIQQHRHSLSTRRSTTASLPVAFQVPVEVWNMVQQHLVARAVAEARAAVQRELHCAECEQREVDRRVGSQADNGPAEEYFELEGFVESEVREEGRAVRELGVGAAEWIDYTDACTGHAAASQRYAKFMAEGLHAKPLARLLASSGLHLPSPTSKGLARPLVKSSFTTTLAIQLPRATAHQVRSAFEFSPWSLRANWCEEGPLEDGVGPGVRGRLGPAVKEGGAMARFLRRWGFGSPTRGIGPRARVRRGGEREREGGDVGLVAGEEGEVLRPRWIVAASRGE